MKVFIITLLALITAATAMPQTGTYRLNVKGGASCTIAITKQGRLITGDVFAWWHTPSGTHGVFTGEGMLKNNTASLKSKDYAGCRVSLKFSPGYLKAGFDDCMDSNLPDDFSGVYSKLTNNIPGEYKVTAAKAYFYKSTDLKTRLKTYLVKGDKVQLGLENISDGKWVFINYTSKGGKTISGYMQWSVLK